MKHGRVFNSVLTQQQQEQEQQEQEQQQQEQQQQEQQQPSPKKINFYITYEAEIWYVSLI